MLKDENCQSFHNEWSSMASSTLVHRLHDLISEDILAIVEMACLDHYPDVLNFIVSYDKDHKLKR